MLARQGGEPPKPRVATRRSVGHRVLSVPLNHSPPPSLRSHTLALFSAASCSTIFFHPHLPVPRFAFPILAIFTPPKLASLIRSTSAYHRYHLAAQFSPPPKSPSLPRRPSQLSPRRNRPPGGSSRHINTSNGLRRPDRSGPPLSPLALFLLPLSNTHQPPTYLPTHPTTPSLHHARFPDCP